MAVKYFCDGCDRQTDVKEVSVKIEHYIKSVGIENAKVPGKIYDLCVTCDQFLRERANPNSWVRVVQEPSRRTG
jgi:hypothetical protein